jgi:hypothetical protein
MPHANARRLQKKNHFFFLKTGGDVKMVLSFETKVSGRISPFISREDSWRIICGNDKFSSKECPVWWKIDELERGEEQ